MTASSAVVPRLRYFVHEDFDALRMEIAGSLVGRAAQKAYESWRSAFFLTRRARLVEDITHVTEADEDGMAVLKAWHGQAARIVASSKVSRKIADSILRASVPQPSARTTIFGRLASFLSWHSAGNPASAESPETSSADAKESHVDNIQFPAAGVMEDQMR
jgi:hypothetical protein